MTAVGKQSIGQIAAVLVIIVVAIGIYGFLRPSESLLPGIEGGRVEIERKDFGRSFVYLPVDEARELLAEARADGEFKFLFPQVDLDGVERLVVENTQIETSDGQMMTLLGIKGLPEDAKIYSNFDGTIRSSSIDHENAGNPPMVIFTGNSGNFDLEFYIPYSPETDEDPLGTSEVVKVVFGTHLADATVQTHLDGKVFPAGWQMAMIIQGLDSEGLDHSSLDNVLMRGGKIVMVEL